MNDALCQCVFVKWSQSSFEIITIHINDLNIIETSNELKRSFCPPEYEFEIKYKWERQTYLLA